MYQNPYEELDWEKSHWLRGNFHTHCGARPGDNCGKLPLDDVAACYKDCGYDFLAITNHDALTILPKAEPHLPLLLEGYEYSFDGHMLCIGSKSLSKDAHEQAASLCCQEGGVVIACHPHWKREDYWTAEKILSYGDITGMEVYNGVISRLSGRGLASDTWDEVLSSGRLIWGLANDDFHRWYDLARCWNMFFSAPNQCAIIEAVKKGRFYASTGLYLTELKITEGQMLSLSAVHHNGFEEEMRYEFIGSGSRILSVKYGTSASLLLDFEEPYVRVCITAQNGAKLWTQPVYRSEFFERNQL